MPSNKAILADIYDLGLDPKIAHTVTGKDGHLVSQKHVAIEKQKQPDNKVVDKVVPIKEDITKPVVEELKKPVKTKKEKPAETITTQEVQSSDPKPDAS